MVNINTINKLSVRSMVRRKDPSIPFEPKWAIITHTYRKYRLMHNDGVYYKGIHYRQRMLWGRSLGNPCCVLRGWLL
jgi:hypothetical protein